MIQNSSKTNKQIDFIAAELLNLQLNGDISHVSQTVTGLFL